MKRLFENPLIGDRIFFKKFAHEPGEAVTIIDVALKPGGGNGLHFHETFDEHFECLEGELSLEVNKRVIVLQPGETATAPRRAVHRFFNQSNSYNRFRVTISPGHPGFENTLKIAYGLASDGLMNAQGRPRKFWHLGTIVALSDTHLPGVFRLLQPLLRYSARRAHADGRFARELQPYTAD
ncbi:cupin domain-containing protein [Hymenobacter sp. ASUV-10]|uniref:Cupin domain-containing protein n=1 Tax=Hymenobacter aranciens TaxID=3063996 RepID=A0ABT9B9P9_9BACT|nr:cupin domain-containing protein [Hymenobacter sp. ASUV-10]MDO7874388.1 cupin domain-containing protein [Hymenobacter sp. ASUV-10]